MTARFLASWTQFHWSNGQSKSVDRKKPRFSAVFRGFHGTELVEPPFDPHSCSCAMVTPIVAAKKRAAKKAKRITTMERLERQFISQSQQLSALCNTLQDQIEAVEAVEREFRRDIANMGAYLDGAPPPTKRARSPSRAVASPDEDDDDDDADEDAMGRHQEPRVQALCWKDFCAHQGQGEEHEQKVLSGQRRLGFVVELLGLWWSTKQVVELETAKK